MASSSSLPNPADDDDHLHQHASLSPCLPDASDPAFRLFGQLIALPFAAQHDSPPHPSGLALMQEEEEENCDSNADHIALHGVDELAGSSGSNSGSDEEATPRQMEEGTNDGFEKTGGDPNAEVRNCHNRSEEVKVKSLSATVNQDKALSKPDKLVPCPRCESMDTKFCYFNNYNVSQPRHFCRSCQRYWTAGGTLRNVPVGAGRRKTKHLNSPQKQSSTASSTLGEPRGNDPNGAEPLLNCSVSQVPSFKSRIGRPKALLESHIPAVEPRYCPDSSSSSSSISSSLTSLTADTAYQGDLRPSFKKMLGARIPEVLHMKDELGSSASPAETGDEAKIALLNGVNDSSEGSNTTEASTERKYNSRRFSSTANLAPGSDSSADGDGVAGADSTSLEAGYWQNGLVSPFLCGFWPYMFSMGWPGAGLNMAPLAGGSNGLWQWPNFPGPAWGPQGSSFPWSLPWNAAAAAAAAGAVAANANAVIAAGLGKRPRRVSEGMSDGSLCIPKTLRIHDPEEAARSSILKTLGVCNKTESLTSGGFFNAFQPKAEVFQPKVGMKNSEDKLLAKHANPAAMARSMSFQENM